MVPIAAPHSLTWPDLLDRPYGCVADGCVSTADCLLDGEPFCLLCAELLIERLGVPRSLRQGLPPLFDGTARLTHPDYA